MRTVLTIALLTLALLTVEVCDAAPPAAALQGAIELPAPTHWELLDEFGNYWGQASRADEALFPDLNEPLSLIIDFNGNGVQDGDEWVFPWEKKQPGPHYQCGSFCIVFTDHDDDGMPDSWCYWQDTDFDGTHETRVAGGSIGNQ